MDPFDESRYLVDMYADQYFPRFLVDKIRDLIKSGVAVLESGERDPEVIQETFDTITVAINDLEDEFYENGSEIETMARDSIGQTVIDIIAHFDLDLDVEDLLAQREW
ncbi:MAG: DUF5713 family protein [Micrococcales bacterium]|nr:DUF5713 family protein [Micrococcales bacterium]